MVHRIYLQNVDIVTPFEVLKKQTLLINEIGNIENISEEGIFFSEKNESINLENKILIPGLIDIHVHGGNGITFNDGDIQENIIFYSNWAPKNGVTHFLCSIAAPTPDKLLELIEQAVRVFKNPVPGAVPLGLHLEGPFLNIDKKGAANPAWLRPPTAELANAYLEAGEGWIKQVTIAPELSGAEIIAKIFHDNNVVVSFGHSNADFLTAQNALKGFYSNVTHAFNAQKGLHHREPGALGAVLSSDGITAELIADLIHVHPAAIKILIRCLGFDRINLITDGMAGAGLGDGLYSLSAHPVHVNNRKATLDDGTLAGSTVLLNQCVRNIFREIHLPFHQAVQMASLNPAKLLKLDHELGHIKNGMKANFVVVDYDLNVYLTFVNGKKVFDIEK